MNLARRQSGVSAVEAYLQAATEMDLYSVPTIRSTMLALLPSLRQIRQPDELDPFSLHDGRAVDREV